MSSAGSKPHAHVVGVAGVGMSAVAQALLDRGYDVSGSDRFLDQGESLDVLGRLAAGGVRLLAQDGAGVRANTSAVVVSTAIEKDNPDLLAAQRLGARVVHRAAMLAELARGQDLIAVTGTSGKTTVTGMVGWILEQAGWDPTVVCGGVVLDWQRPDRVGSVRKGGGGIWVLEADESDRSLLQFHSRHAVITNVSKDHFELSEVIELFRAFAGQVREAIVGGPGVREMLKWDAILSEPFDPVLREGRWTFPFAGLDFSVPVMGRHNAENAFVSAMLCRELKVPLECIRDALSRFGGIHRRLECVGEARGIRVLDDYAHNPAKVAASWNAVGESGGRILGFWRPHGFGPLSLMKDELVATFRHVVRASDRLWVLPVFFAGGTARKDLTSETFVRLLRDAGVPANYAASYAALGAAVRAEARAGDVVLGMGARDPELPRFARRCLLELARA